MLPSNIRKSFHLKYNSSNQEGFAVPLVLIIAAFILAIPAYYWVSSNSLNVSPSKEIQGASTVNTTSAKPGFSVTVTSNAETWDLIEYLCEDRSECVSSLEAGKRWGTVSGGQADLHEVFVEYSPEWEGYDYIKYYVKPGWFATDSQFVVVDKGEVPGTEVVSLGDGASTTYKVVLTPVTRISGEFYTSAQFSDTP